MENPTAKVRINLKGKLSILLISISGFSELLFMVIFDHSPQHSSTIFFEYTNMKIESINFYYIRFSIGEMQPINTWSENDDVML